MERFCNDLKEHVTKIINYQKKKKEMMLLTCEVNKSYKKKKFVIYAERDLVLIWQ